MRGESGARSGRPAEWLPWAAGAWALGYGIYRGYYALGGTAGMFGTPVSMSDWYFINAVATALLLGAAVVPVVTRSLWTRPPWRTLLLGATWMVAVGCIMHALIGIITRVLSLAGLLAIEYPFFRTIDTTAADLQALLFNEPWFLVEGLLWAAMGWFALRTVESRSRWVLSIAGAVAALTLIGVLSSLGVIGRFIAG